TVSLGTLQGLVSAGRLGVIGDPELRTALASWGIALAELAEEELDSRAYVYSDLHQVLRTRTDTYGLWSAASRLFNGTLSPEEMAGTRRVPVDSEVVGVFDLRGNLLRHGIDEFAPLIAEVDGILMLIDQALSDPAGGARQFQRSVALEDSAETSANVSLGDLNADGHLDVVLVKGRHWPLLDLVRLGDGTGSLRPAYPVGSVPDRSYSGVLVDMDGDGDLDIVVSNDNPDPKVVHLNDGSGRYQVGSTFGRPEWSTRHVSVADLNGDGLPDVVLANRHPEGSALSYICFGVGGGRFADECVGFARGSATTVTPADFNRDGALDLAVPYRDGGQSYIYLNDGAGGFADRLPFGPPDAAIRS
ncbi:MAG TPA: VCBS repeat-containing protein, partial [Longimicrobiales bacterium]|nr:VCBS repeat-containing protein [Longimicrobiales bacterium]